jgi:hypothetical protein
VPFTWGPQSPALRHQGFGRSARDLSGVMGSEACTSCRSGTTCLPYIWRHRYSALVSLIRRLYNLSDAQLQQVKQKLITLKPNIRKLWSSGRRANELIPGSRSHCRDGLAFLYRSPWRMTRQPFRCVRGASRCRQALSTLWCSLQQKLLQSSLTERFHRYPCVAGPVLSYQRVSLATITVALLPFTRRPWFPWMRSHESMAGDRTSGKRTRCRSRSDHA